MLPLQFELVFEIANLNDSIFISHQLINVISIFFERRDFVVYLRGIMPIVP